MKLSKRLGRIASFVPRGSIVADIGTDHGYIPIYLVREGLVPSAIAMDVRSGPLERARFHIEQEGLSQQIETRLSDGLTALAPKEVSTVVIAGMGGELIMQILSMGSHMWQSVKHWVLSPQSDLDKVRRFLQQHGFCIVDEDMVFEEGKYYTIIVAEPGVEEAKTQAQYLYGPVLIRDNNPVLAAFLHREEKQYMQIIEALEKQDTEGAKKRAGDLKAALLLIKEAQHEMQ